MDTIAVEVRWQRRSYNDIAGHKFDVESAGLDPKPINPQVVEVMLELGIDLSKARADSVFDFFREGRLYDYVITVCDETAAGQCPVFPGIVGFYNMPGSHGRISAFASKRKT